MPRPKVRPENRQRSSKACTACKASKIRCDSHTPCASCVKRGRPMTCTYEVAQDRRSHRRNEATAKGSTPHLGDSSAESPSASLSVHSSPVRGSQTLQGAHSSYSSPLIMRPGNHEQDSPKDRFLTSSNGEKVYIGESASLPFLHFLRQVVRQLVGTSTFTNGPLHSNALEIYDETMDGDLGEISASDQMSLYQSYTEATGALLDLFSTNEIETLVQHSPPSPITTQDAAALKVALAIGIQARAFNCKPAHSAAGLFDQARQVAFQGMLAHPSLSMVRLFILLAFYALGACQPNAAFIYLGIASKTAIVLGLHQPTSWECRGQDDVPNQRLRTWHSLCIVDVITSSLLGRPCTVPRATRHSLDSIPLDACQPAFNAVLKGAALLDDICRELSRAVPIDVPTAEVLLGALRSWSFKLPDCLRRFHCSRVAPRAINQRRDFFCNIHVSAMYYFSTIMVTRPFLLQCLMSKLRRTHAGDSTTDPKVAELAQVCINSAMYIGDLCQDASSATNTSDLPIGNFCLFKAWAFGAGLILGFAMLAGEQTLELQDSYNGVRDILQLIGQTCPQSHMYKSILDALAESIRTFRRRQSRNGQKEASNYIDRILVIENTRTRPNQTNCDMDPETFDILGAHFDLSDDLANAQSVALADPPLMDYGWLVQEDWDGMAMQFPDSFSIDYSAAPPR